MQKLLLLAALCTVALSIHAQDPDRWNFAAKKIDDKTFEIQMTAAVQSSAKRYILYYETGFLI